jgi:hypothetical protein
MQAEDMLREARQLLDEVDLNSAGHPVGGLAAPSSS